MQRTVNVGKYQHCRVRPLNLCDTACMEPMFAQQRVLAKSRAYVGVSRSNSSAVGRFNRLQTQLQIGTWSPGLYFIRHRGHCCWSSIRGLSINTFCTSVILSVHSSAHSNTEVLDVELRTTYRYSPIIIKMFIF